MESYHLYNFVTEHTDIFSHEEMVGLMQHDLSMRDYLPQSPIYHTLFHCRLLQGYAQAEALADVLQTYLLAGGTKKQLFPRGSSGTL